MDYTAKVVKLCSSWIKSCDEQPAPDAEDGQGDGQDDLQQADKDADGEGLEKKQKQSKQKRENSSKGHWKRT
jgi:hypothetical protein